MLEASFDYVDYCLNLTNLKHFSYNYVTCAESCTVSFFHNQVLVIFCFVMNEFMQNRAVRKFMRVCSTFVDIMNGAE